MSTAPKSHHPAFLALVEDAKTRVREITVDEHLAQSASGDPGILIDTREESEWAAGHAQGAIWLGKGIIERDIEAKVPDHNAKLVLYCGGGFRSAIAADNLQKMGYTNVLSLAGGWRAWTGANLPVEK